MSRSLFLTALSSVAWRVSCLCTLSLVWLTISSKYSFLVSMSLFKKVKRAARHYMTMKAVRRKIGLTGKSRHLRQLKRSLRGPSGAAVLGGTVPTSAGNYEPRSISQLMGGV